MDQESTRQHNVDRRDTLKLGGLALSGTLLSACAKTASAPTSAEKVEVTGLIGAMKEEVKEIENEMVDKKTASVSGMDFVQGRINGHEVVLGQCGMGKVNAAMCALTLINEFGATRLINTGVGGGLSKDLGINDFVISTDVVQHDFDVSAIGFKKGEIPFTGLISFAADEKLREQALAAVKDSAPNSQVIEGRICSGDQFVSTAEQVSKITSEYGGMCADMESGGVSQVCYLCKVPFVIIRAISDDSDSMSYDEFMAEVAKECSHAVLSLFTNA